MRHSQGFRSMVPEESPIPNQGDLRDSHIKSDKMVLNSGFPPHRRRFIAWAVKLAFHGSDTDILADILARIVARMSACRSACHRNNFRKSRVSDVSARILAWMSVSVSVSMLWNSSLMKLPGTFRSSLDVPGHAHWARQHASPTGCSAVWCRAVLRRMGCQRRLAFFRPNAQVRFPTAN